MPFTSQRYIDDRTGAIVIQVPLSEISHFTEYSGPVEAGGFDLQAQQAATMPDCPHSACSQNFIDTGETGCIEAGDQGGTMSVDVKRLIEHWGIPRKEILQLAAEDLERFRAEARPKSSDRHQYDAWTRTMVAVIKDEA